MIPGTEITLGEKKYTMPPLNLFAIEKHDAFFKRVVSGGVKMEVGSDDLKALGDVVYLSLRRNYPDITADDVKQNIDLSNMLAIFTAAMGVQGFSEPQPGEAPASP